MPKLRGTLGTVAVCRMPLVTAPQCELQPSTPHLLLRRVSYVYTPMQIAKQLPAFRVLHALACIALAAFMAVGQQASVLLAQTGAQPAV